MPKLRMSDAEADRQRIRNNLDLIRGNSTVKEFAESVGIPYSTLRNRIQCPDLLTYAEITRICKIYRIDVAKFMTQKMCVGWKE